MPTDNEIMIEYRKLARVQVGPEKTQIAIAEAKRKLADIISRYGDSDGARCTAKYAAMLVDEAVTAGELEERTFECAKTAASMIKEAEIACIAEERGTSYTVPAFIKELAQAKAEIKKGRSTQETTNQKTTHTYYTALKPTCQ